MTGPFPKTIPATSMISAMSGNSGGPVSAKNGIIQLIGAGGITVSGSGSTLTISGSSVSTVPNPTEDGQIPIGSSNGGFSLATLTAGTGVSIVNGPGSKVTISATGSGNVPVPVNFGQLIIGNGTPNPSIGSLTGTNGVVVTPGSGTLSVGLPGGSNGQVLIGSGGNYVAGSITGTAPIVVTSSAGNVAISLTAGNVIPPSLTSGQIYVGNASNTPVATTLGVTGGLTSTAGSGSLSIGLPTAGATTGQVLTFNGTSYVPTSLSPTSLTLPSGQIYVGNSSNNPVATSLSVTGGLTSASGSGTLTIGLPTAGATTGQALIFNGTNYTPTTLPAGTPSLPSGEIYVGNSSNAPVATTLGVTGGLTSTSGSGSLSIGLPTAGATTGQVLTFNGTNYAPASLPAGVPFLASGQIYVGNASNAPVATTLGVTGGLIATAGAGTLSLGLPVPSAPATPGQVLTYFATPPAPFTGSPPGYYPATTSSFTWQLINTSTFSLLSNNGYYVVSSSNVIMTLPASPNAGDVIIVTSNGTSTSSIWTINTSGSQTIRVGAYTTASGGNISATQQGDSVSLVCTTSGSSGQWVIYSSQGNITIN
jgi:hypothetical protein